MIRTRGSMELGCVPLAHVYGGAERFALELARAMARRVPTTLVSFGDTSRELRLDQLDVRVLRNWIPYRRFRFDPFAPSLVRALAADGLTELGITLGP